MLREMVERVGRSKATNAPLYAVKTAPTGQAFHRKCGSGWGRLVSTANRHGSTASALFGRPQPVEAGLSRQSAANHREHRSDEWVLFAVKTAPTGQAFHRKRGSGWGRLVSIANRHGSSAGALFGRLQPERQACPGRARRTIRNSAAMSGPFRGQDRSYRSGIPPEPWERS